MTPIAKKTESNLIGGFKAAIARAEAAEARLAEEREEWLVSMSSIEDARQEAEALAEAAEQRAERAERLLRAAYADLRAAEDRALEGESRLARAMEGLRPFAKWESDMELDLPDDMPVISNDRDSPIIGDIRRARAVLKEMEGKDE